MDLETYRQRSCREKRRHKTAKKALTHARQSGHGFPYRCAFCRGWHIGH